MPAVEDVVEAMTSAMTRIMKSSGWDLEVVIAFEPMARTSKEMDRALQKLYVIIIQRAASKYRHSSFNAVFWAWKKPC